MAPTLYSNPMSPPCRLVHLVANIVGVDLNVVGIKSANTEMKTPERLKKNPQHTIPFLEDDGLYISESRAISTYLISKYGKDDSLYPKDVNKRVLVDQRLFFDQDLYNKILAVFLPKFQGKQADPSSIEKVNDGLETLNRMLDGKQWLAGDKVTLADYSVGISLQSLEYAPEAGIDPTKQPNVKQWLSRIEKSNPKYGESLNEFREALKKMGQK